MLWSVGKLSAQCKRLTKCAFFARRGRSVRETFPTRSLGITIIAISVLVSSAPPTSAVTMQLDCKFAVNNLVFRSQCHTPRPA